MSYGQQRSYMSNSNVSPFGNSMNLSALKLYVENIFNQHRLNFQRQYGNRLKVTTSVVYLNNNTLYGIISVTDGSRIENLQITAFGTKNQPGVYGFMFQQGSTYVTKFNIGDITITRMG